MALDIKGMIVRIFLEMCEKKELNKITIKDIQEKTGLSRQTFYNHFKDKDDLIQYCYDSVIVPDWYAGDNSSDGKLDDDYIADMFLWRTEYLKSIIKYGRFMKMACAMDGPNCLWEHIFSETIEFELKWHETLFRRKLTKEMIEATEYHTFATTYMIVDWIKNDMPVSAEELTNKIMRNKVMSLGEILGGNKYSSHYVRMREFIMQKEGA